MTKRVREILLRRTLVKDKPFDVKRNWLRAGWERAKTMLGHGTDKQYVPHTLRHTCASRMVQAGVPLAVIQVWLGHKSIVVTNRYSHLAPTSLLAGLKALERKG